MDAEGINVIKELAVAAAANTVEVGGRVYPTSPLFDPRKPDPEPDPLAFHTLASFVEFVKSGHDEDYRAMKGLFVHVASPTEVRLHTGVFGEFNQRVTLACAEAITPEAALGRFMDPEAFNIGLLVNFVASDDRAAVQAIVGNLTTEAVQTIADDGVSQSATMRASVARVGTVKVPSPVVLRPFRTFAEVEQPASPFILRLRGGSKETLPSCALFECDGGRWRLAAIEVVKSFLVDALGDTTPVYG